MRATEKGIVDKLELGIFVAVMIAAPALILSALRVRSRPSGEPMSCPNCGGATRFHEPYLMCDKCKHLVGVRINVKAYPSR
jgi:hypothetical protein